MAIETYRGRKRDKKGPTHPRRRLDLEQQALAMQALALQALALQALAPQALALQALTLQALTLQALELQERELQERELHARALQALLALQTFSGHSSLVQCKHCHGLQRAVCMQSRRAMAVSADARTQLRIPRSTALRFVALERSKFDNSLRHVCRSNQAQSERPTRDLSSAAASLADPLEDAYDWLWSRVSNDGDAVRAVCRPFRAPTSPVGGGRAGSRGGLRRRTKIDVRAASQPGVLRKSTGKAMHLYSAAFGILWQKGAM